MNTIHPNSVKRPSLEKISPEFGSSFTVKQYLDPCVNTNVPFWHFHPELELVYVNGGNGKRHIGNHLSYYHDGDLILIGSMLPHTGFTNRLSGNRSETIIQFHPDFMGADFFHKNEMQDVKQLFERAKAGIVFTGEAKRVIGAKMEVLATKDKFARFVDLICILQDMAWTKEYTILNADGYSFEVEHADNDRINLIYDYVRANFQQSIPLEEIAAIANLTVPAFCRYFKKLSGKTFTRFVNEFRIVHACKLLSEKQDSITNICYESGFNNFSHFNRLFKDITGKSPSNYRKQIKNVLVNPAADISVE